MTDTPDQRSGGCHCGRIRYRLDEPPKWVAHCHCRDCRRSTGGTFTTYAGYPSGALHIERGEPARYDSPAGAQRSFCRDCGSSLSYASARWPDEVHMLVASFDDADDLRPAAHVYVNDRLRWHEIGDDLPQHPTVPSESSC